MRPIRRVTVVSENMGGVLDEGIRKFATGLLEGFRAQAEASGVATSGGDLIGVSFVFVMGLVSTPTLDGGGLCIAGSAKIDPVTGCATTVKMAVTGEIVAIISTEDVSLFITKGKLKAGKPIVILTP